MPRPTLLFSLVLALAGGCVPVLESPDGGVKEPWVAPENTWPVDVPPAGLEGTGFYEGDVIPDFRLVDQYGDVVSLWQFHGRVVVVDISTMWCGPCRELAEDAEALFQDHEEDGLMYVTVLPENVEGADPTVEDLALWAEHYGLTTPVVADPGKLWAAPAVPQDQYPFVAVLDVDLRVAARPNPPTDANVRAAVDALLP
jgi:thiol-disulfide isomerase/thioredoxin